MKGSADKKHSETQKVTQKSKSGTDTFQFEDYRSSSITQRKMQSMANSSQRVAKFSTLQRMADKSIGSQSKTPKQSQNNTGLPNQLKAGVENLSGMSMDDVKVHYKSDKPAQLQAHAYAQGTNIHIAPGQEKHLPHEAWHVVQQKQGRVRPTMQLKDAVPVNDDSTLEKEADVMGAKALQTKSQSGILQAKSIGSSYSVAQREETESTATLTTNLAWGLIKSVLTHEKSKARFTAIINPLLKAGDSLIADRVSAWTGLSALVPGINYLILTCKGALAIWDSIPDNIKTGILYVMGVLTANAPVLSRYESLQGLIVKGDEGAVREKVASWTNSATYVVSYLTQPLTSLYNFLTGGSSEKATTSESGEKGEETPDKAQAQKLINLNLQVITLMINNLKLGYDKKTPVGDESEKSTESGEKDKKDPGLIVEFFVQLHLFNHNIPERAGKGMDQLFFPFSGEFRYKAGSKIVINSSDKTLLGNTLGPVYIYPLEVSKSGVKSAGLEIDKLIIGNGIVILTGAMGTIKNKLVTLKTGAEVNLAGHQIGGSMNLQLNDGSFKSLSLKDVNKSGNLTLNSFSIDSSYSGEANVSIKKMDLLKNTLSATNVVAAASVSNKKFKSFDFKMEKFLLDFWGSNVKIEGAHMSYIGANPEKEIDENITGGATEIDANIKGVNLNLKDLELDKKEGNYEFSSGSLKFKDFEITIEKASMKNGGIVITKATLSIPKYNIEGSVKSFSWNSDGLDFDSLSLALPGKTISPVDSVSLSNMSLELIKGGGYQLILTSDINVAPMGSKPVLGAKAAQLKLTKDEISGTLKQLNINTSYFDVLIKNAEFNKNRVGAAEAGISFKSKEEEQGYAKMMPKFDTGLLDFINLDTGLKVTDAYFNKGKGFSIGGVYPELKAFTISLFGVEATVNPEDRSITIKSSFTFPGNKPPVWPFILDVPFPIFIGIAGRFGIELDGGVKLTFDSKFQREKGKNKPYKFNAKPGIGGSLSLKISAGAEFGARLAVALQANLYAQSTLKINTSANLTGALQYMNGKFAQIDPLKALYELKSIVTAEVGGELKVKAFMFYDKQLTKVKFKDWTLGEWSKSGELGSNSEGERTEKGKEGAFAKAVKEPTMDQQIVEGEEARKLLLATHERIIGSGVKRKELITSLTVDVSKLASSLLIKQQKIKKEFDKSMSELMKIIIRKDAFFRKHFESDEIQAMLDKFDRENKLDEKRDFIRQKGGVLDEYDIELKKIMSLMNDVESGLDVVALENGAGASKEKIDNQKEKAESIDQNLEGISAPRIDSSKLDTELSKMGAEALSVSVSASVMTSEKWIQISTTRGIIRDENPRKRVKPVDEALQSYDNVRESLATAQLPKLENLLKEINIYETKKFSSRTQAVLLLKYQVEEAIKKLKKG